MSSTTNTTEYAARARESAKDARKAKRAAASEAGLCAAAARRSSRAARRANRAARNGDFYQEYEAQIVVASNTKNAARRAHTAAYAAHVAMRAVVRAYDASFDAYDAANKARTWDNYQDKRSAYHDASKAYEESSRAYFSASSASDSPPVLPDDTQNKTTRNVNSAVMQDLYGAVKAIVADEAADAARETYRAVTNAFEHWWESARIVERAVVIHRDIDAALNELDAARAGILDAAEAAAKAKLASVHAHEAHLAALKADSKY